MSCNCGGNRREFEHVAKDGTITVVTSQYEAIKLTAKQGGTWRIKKR